LACSVARDGELSILRGYETGTFWNSRALVGTQDVSRQSARRAGRPDHGRRARKPLQTRACWIAVAQSGGHMSPSFSKECDEEGLDHPRPVRCLGRLPKTTQTGPNSKARIAPLQDTLRTLLEHASGQSLSHGTQTDGGERAIERLLSASVTCRLRKQSLFAYLIQVTTAHARGEPNPRPRITAGVNAYRKPTVCRAFVRWA
jgi:hypothetical protein